MRSWFESLVPLDRSSWHLTRLYREGHLATKHGVYGYIILYKYTSNDHIFKDQEVGFMKLRGQPNASPFAGGLVPSAVAANLTGCEVQKCLHCELCDSHSVCLSPCFQHLFRNIHLSLMEVACQRQSHIIDHYTNYFFTIPTCRLMSERSRIQRKDEKTRQTKVEPVSHKSVLDFVDLSIMLNTCLLLPLS